MTTLSHCSTLSHCDQGEFNTWHSHMDIEGKRFCSDVEVEKAWDRHLQQTPFQVALTRWDGYSRGGDCNWEEIKPVQWSILVHVHSMKGLSCGSWPGWGIVWHYDNDSQTRWGGQGGCHRSNGTCRRARVRGIPQGRGGHSLGLLPSPQGATIPLGAQDTVRS